jgi:hypothetical protein
MTSNGKNHLKGIIVDYRLIWKKVVASLDLHLSVKVFPSNIVA